MNTLNKEAIRLGSCGGKKFWEKILTEVYCGEVDMWCGEWFCGRFCKIVLWDWFSINDEIYRGGSAVFW